VDKEHADKECLNKEHLNKEHADVKREDEEYLVNQYIMQFDEIEKKAYLISQSHLKSSFNILRSNGFIEWKKKQT
jgi:SOS-response transcriptional repressor LexA